MAILRLIKRRIKTTKNIAQITRAMEMVAASKMRRAQEQTQSSRPYADKLYQVTQELRKRINPKIHPFFSEKKEGKSLIFLIAPEKGLSGALVTNLLRFLLSLPNGSKFITLGKKSRSLVLKAQGEIVAEFQLGLRPNYDIVPPIAKIMTDNFLNGEVSEVAVIYSHFVGIMNQEPTAKRLLPITGFDEKDFLTFEYLFEPQAQDLLKDLLPHYLEMQIYQTILEAFASEQAARMVAMRAATENAQEIIAELQLVYNKERQQVITTEIADIATAKIALEE